MLNVGSKLGPYEILSSLGAGGMGEVYRARDSRLGREVALKVLPESFSNDADRLRRFEQEARAVAALSHPNILAIHDIGEQSGVRFIVSELLDGRTLRAELENGAIPQRKATEYAMQIAHGLAAAHSKNIIHRDLKPENIFITKDGGVKILDFGLAKLTPASADAGFAGQTLTSSPTEAGVVMGTAGYMSPEQVRGATINSRADIFAFGAVLYEMVSGKRAFRRDTAPETMTAILKEDPAEIPETGRPVSPGLERIIRRCLEKQPEQRFQSAKDLAFALEALTGTTTTKTGANAIVPAARRTRGWVAVVLAAVIGLAVGAGAVWILRPRTAEAPTFTPVSFDRGEVIRARFAPDGKTIVYSGKLNGRPADTYIVREDYPQALPLGLHGALVLSISRQGQMAVLERPQYFAHTQWGGTLATSPLNSSAPRELLENVYDADWAPNGNDLAIIDLDHNKWQLQYPIGKVLISGDNWLSEARVSPDGEHVALFHHPPNIDDRGEVIVVDRGGKVQTLWPGWESLEGLAWSASGKEIWFSGAESGEQYCIRAVTLSGKRRTVYCGTAPTRIHDIAPSGRALLSTENLSRTMEMVEHGSGEIRDLTWLDFSYGPSLSEDGSEILFTDLGALGGNDYSDYMRKTDGSAAVRIGSGGFVTDVSPDGKWGIVLLPGDAKAEVTIIPVGPGQPHTMHWDGFVPQWARWAPDGQRIILHAVELGKGAGVYVTDVNGTQPKFIANDELDTSGVAPDGKSVLVRQNGSWMLATIGEANLKPVAIQADETPIAWTTDSAHVFTQIPNATGIDIYKFDVVSGRQQLWQAVKPKDQLGLEQVSAPTAITHDGRRMVVNYSNQTGELYRSDTLK